VKDLGEEGGGVISEGTIPEEPAERRSIWGKTRNPASHPRSLGKDERRPGGSSAEADFDLTLAEDSS